MSFTTQIKNEISRINNTRLESIAELSGFLRNNGEYDETEISLVTENATVAKRIYTLIKEIFDITCEIETRKGNNFSKNNLYLINIEEKIDKILKDLSIINEEKELLKKPASYIIDSEDETRAYLRGAFMAKGSVNDPKTSRYHMEITTDEKDEANFIKELLDSFYLNSKVLSRDKGYMVYLKEAEKIGDFLRIINANQAVMYYEDIRIYRDHKNMTNRLNNCEQANVDKVVESAISQVKDIKIIRDNDAFDLLDDKLKTVAIYREKYEETSLQELADIITVETGIKITKSGIYHRMNKIRDFANKFKNI